MAAGIHTVTGMGAHRSTDPLDEDPSDATTPRAHAGRHRRDTSDGENDPLVITRHHRPTRDTRRRLPAPNLSALVTLAVLILIGAAAVHVSSRGSAIPPQTDAATAAESPPISTDATDDASASDSDREDTAAGDTAPSATTRSDGADPDADSATGDPNASSHSSEIVVHVSGAVTSPGLVRCPAGARVDDAVRAAGGALPEADVTALNLARPLSDGEQIHVPVPGEDPLPVQPTAASAGAAAGSDAAGGAAADGAAGPVDINTASSEQLQQVPGIGPSIAGRIIEHRETNGPFSSVDQLEEVSGIGPATLEKLREHVRV